MQDMFTHHGDRIASQYAGSGALHKEAIKRKGSVFDNELTRTPQEEYVDDVDSPVKKSNAEGKKANREQGQSKSLSLFSVLRSGKALAQNAGSAVKRYYANTFTDRQKQHALALFHGQLKPLMSLALAVSIYEREDEEQSHGFDVVQAQEGKHVNEEKGPCIFIPRFAHKLWIDSVNADAASRTIDSPSGLVSSISRRRSKMVAEFDNFMTNEEIKARNQADVDHLRHNFPNIICVMTKTNEKRMLVYGANLHKQHKDKLNTQTPLEMFYLKEMTMSRKMAQKRQSVAHKIYGKSEPSILEKRFDVGYGARTTLTQADAKAPQRFSVQLHCLSKTPHKYLTLRISPKGQPILCCYIQNKMYQLTKIHLQTKKRTFGPDKLVSILLYAKDIITGKTIMDRCIP
jgi:hypothetical protein